MENFVQLKENILSLLEEIRVFDPLEIKVYDTRKQVPWTDLCLMVKLRTPAQLLGLYETLVLEIKKYGWKTFNQNFPRSQENGWLLLDLGDAVIHLMLEEQASFYQLEEFFEGSQLILHEKKEG